METTYPADKPAKHDLDAQKHQVKAKSKPQKPDRRLRELEELHQGTNVKASIQLEEGRRIKLDNGAPLDARSDNKKTKTAPKFDLAFSDLKADEPAAAGDALDLAVSDDELPDTRDILTAFDRKKGKKPARSSETHYSDPDIDHYIEKYVDVLSPAQPVRKTTARNSSPDVQDLTMSSPPPKTPPARKRSRDEEMTSLSLKRRKLTTETNLPSISRKVRENNPLGCRPY